jgi:hypothetical protein
MSPARPCANRAGEMAFRPYIAWPTRRTTRVATEQAPQDQGRDPIADRRRAAPLRGLRACLGRGGRRPRCRNQRRHVDGIAFQSRRIGHLCVRSCLAADRAALPAALRLGAEALVSRFRSSHEFAARSDANFGIKGHWQLYDSSAAFEPEVRNQICREIVRTSGSRH